MTLQGQGPLTEADIPSQFRQYVTNLALVPTADELAAVEKEQSYDLRPGVKPQKTEYDIIKIDKDNKLVVWYEIDNGLTVGARIVLFGSKYDVFKDTISLSNPSISISVPMLDGLATVTLSASVDTTQCDLVLSAQLELTWPETESYGGQVHLPYGIPWPTATSGRDGALVNNETLKGISNAPRTPIPPPPPGFIQNDGATVDLLETILWLVNAGDYKDQVVAGVKAAQATPAPSGGSQIDPGSVLVAFGITGQAAAGVGCLGAIGVYVTGDGDIGLFGGGGGEVGALLSASIGLTIDLFWTGLQGFTGVCYNGSAGLSAPAGGGVSVTVFWSNSVPNPARPAGIAVDGAMGIGWPISLYASVTYTAATGPL